jgi:hypothetical protein
VLTLAGTKRALVVTVKESVSCTAANNEYNLRDMPGAEEISREELMALLDLAGELSAQSDQQRVVISILERACAFTNSPEGSILLYDPVRKGLYFAAARGPKGNELLQKFGEQSREGHEGRNQYSPLFGAWCFFPTARNCPGTLGLRPRARLPW